MKNKNWLYIEPYVYIKGSGLEIIFFNTFNNEKVIVTTTGPIEWVNKILIPDNMYCIEIENEDNSNVKSLLYNLSASHIGYVVNSAKKPLSYYPKLNIQRNFLSKTKDKNRNIKFLLHELDIVLNEGISFNNSLALNDYINNESTNRSLEINYSGIRSFIDQTIGTPLGKVTITGGDITAYPHFKDIFHYLKQFNFRKEYIINYSSLKSFNYDLEAQESLAIICGVEEIMGSELENQNKKLIVLVKSEEELKILQNKTKSNFVIYPNINQSSMNFLSNNLFIDKNEIFTNKKTLNELLSHTLFNKCFYGRFIIRANGNVTTGNKVVGKIDCAIEDCISNALDIQSDWFLTRMKVLPCKNCIYQELCPPIGSYELKIGKYNLCHIMGEQ